jgi:hypothetical protein
MGEGAEVGDGPLEGGRASGSPRLGARHGRMGTGWILVLTNDCGKNT